MDCIVIDDEPIAREIIGQLVSGYSELKLVGQFTSAIQAIRYLNHNLVDLIFLDVQMPEFTGFEFLQTIKNPPKIILITSYPKFAIEAFNYKCIVDFLIKPITPALFDKAIKKVILSDKGVKVKKRK